MIGSGRKLTVPETSYTIMRGDNGVKVRHDGRGDNWADQHRRSLRGRFLMQDMDAYAGFHAFAANTGEKFFLEYEPDKSNARTVSKRQLGFVALFDRKSNTKAMRDKNLSGLSRQVYAHICRTYRAAQPTAPKFFYIVGESSPWGMIEIDIDTLQEKSGIVELYEDDWMQIWDDFGLIELRNALQRWMIEEANNA